MICKKCKNDISPEDKFCRNCGKKVRIEKDENETKLLVGKILLIVIFSGLVLGLIISLTIALINEQKKIYRKIYQGKLRMNFWRILKS